MMSALVARSIRDPSIVQVAVNVVRGVDGRDSVGMYDAIRAWLESHIEFLPDPLIDGDVLRAPDFVLAEIALHGTARVDCDDTATLSATFAKAVGLPARFVVLGFPEYRHVFTEILTEDGWCDVDVTESDERREMAADAIQRRAAFPV